jgi:hypothetical protein
LMKRSIFRKRKPANGDSESPDPARKRKALSECPCFGSKSGYGRRFTGRSSAK